MHLMKVDPRALRDNPDNTRQTKSTPQADALLLATIKAVGVIQPPVIFPAADGGNGYIIEAGHRRTRLAIAAGLEEIDVIVVEALCARWSKTSPVNHRTPSTSGAASNGWSLLTERKRRSPSHRPTRR